VSIDASLTSSLNGRMPASMLGQIDDLDRYVWRPLVPQVEAFRAAFAAHFGKPLVITESYRDRPTQVRYRAKYLAGTGAYAVPPGTSKHGWGTALDLGSGVADIHSAEHAWAVANGPTYGAHWLTVAGNGSVEPWHFDLVIVPASQYTPKPAPIPTPTPEPTPQEEIVAYLIQVKEDLRVFYVSDLLFEYVGPEIYDALAQVYGKAKPVDVVSADRIHQQVNANIVATAANLKGQGL
jgi:hypothetical protein